MVATVSHHARRVCSSILVQVTSPLSTQLFDFLSDWVGLWFGRCRGGCGSDLDGCDGRGDAGFPAWRGTGNVVGVFAFHGLERDQRTAAGCMARKTAVQKALTGSFVRNFHPVHDLAAVSESPLAGPQRGSARRDSGGAALPVAFAVFLCRKFYRGSQRESVVWRAAGAFRFAGLYSDLLHSALASLSKTLRRRRAE